MYNINSGQWTLALSSISTPTISTSLSSSSSHRCSPCCPLHARRSFATTPNPFPTATSTHTVSSGLPSTFNPAAPEIEGYKTRLTVERRIFKALTSLPKFSSHPVLLAASPPLTDDGVDRWPIGHDDPFAQVKFESLELDSLDKVEVLVSVEKEFGHEFSDAEFDKFQSVGDLIEAALWSPEAR